jgi:hypothetical protein
MKKDKPEIRHLSINGHRFTVDPDRSPDDHLCTRCGLPGPRATHAKCPGELPLLEGVDAIPGACRCRHCGALWHLTRPGAPCPSCLMVLMVDAMKKELGLTEKDQEEWREARAESVEDWKKGKK